MRTVCVIQARNGGDRLPNKGSIELLGKPMLQHVIERVKRAKRIDEIVVAIPGAPEDDPLLEVITKTHVETYIAGARGIADADLVKRYFRCAQFCNADLIVRICADNPCIESEAIDLLIEHGMGAPDILVSNAGDYDEAERNFGWPDGIGAELYSMDMLKFLNTEIIKPELREHPHKFYHNTHRVIVPPCPVEWRAPNLRLDVNTLEDYEYIKKIYNHFGHNEFHIGDVIKFLDAEKLLGA